jgi:pyroglutamyl-peptidase
MVKVLFSGFEPQWGTKKTPSGELAKVWASGSLKVDDVEVRAVVLPQLFDKSFEILSREAMNFQPHLILMWGATQKNDPIRLEQFAINIKNSSMGDNSRVPVHNIPIIPNAPAGYSTSIPLKQIIDNLKKDDIECVISNHAGTHTCNELSFRIYDWLTKKPFEYPVHALFIHSSYPNSFGIVEDSHFATATFEQLVKTSMQVIKYCADWYREKNAELP